MATTSLRQHAARGALAAAALVLGASGGAAQPARPLADGELEVASCNAFSFERKMFEGWQKLANEAKPTPRKPGYTYEEIKVATADGRTLTGTRIEAKPGAGAGRRALLVLQGNAAYSEVVVPLLTHFADLGFDVYNFDYRGYGKSTGLSLLKPIIMDQKLVIARILAGKYDKLYLYGLSFGGILALSQEIPRDRIAAIAVDSTPATLPLIAWCPAAYYPNRNVPADAKSLMVVSGGKDDVVKIQDVKALGALVKERGGTFLERPEFGHPLMVESAELAERFKLVAGHLSKF